MDAIKRIFAPPSTSYFLFGPRGTGKSTFLKQNYENTTWINLLDPEMLRLYAARPERLLEVVRKSREQTRIFIIDEIQEVPSLLSAVHLLIEEDKTCTFILTGSSARKLKRSGVDLLAGRALVTSMHPFMACELDKQFDIDVALNVGMVPLVVAADNPSDKLKSYVAIYLQEEVKNEGLVRNIGDFSRFLEIISFSHGAEINASNIARECSIGRKAVESYINILQDLLIAYTIPAFTKKAERSSRTHPKFYLFDVGIFRSLRPHGPLDRPEEISGAALEGLVAQHLRAYLAYRNGEDTLYFWRTYSDTEVDFVIYGPESFIAIEVKNTNRLRTEDFRGLRAFNTMYSIAERVILYRGSESLLVDDIHCIPVERFLMNLNPSKSFRESIS
jgi:predicted AAA+ superfamily ATPase